MYLACFGIGTAFCNDLFVGSYVLLRDGFFMLLPCHLGAYLAVSPAAAAAPAAASSYLIYLISRGRVGWTQRAIQTLLDHDTAANDAGR
jgi:hypothetical protein